MNFVSNGIVYFLIETPAQVVANTPADRRRARNRVNAAVSRQKRENYIQYLERGAGFAVTVQGSKCRMAAVDAAWTAVNEGGGGGGGGGDGSGGRSVVTKRVKKEKK